MILISKKYIHSLAVISAFCLLLLISPFKLSAFSGGSAGWVPSPQANSLSWVYIGGYDHHNRYINLPYIGDDWYSYGFSPGFLDFDTYYYSWPSWSYQAYDGCWGDWSNPNSTSPISGPGTYTYSISCVDDTMIREYNAGCYGDPLYDYTNGSTKDNTVTKVVYTSLVSAKIEGENTPYPYMEYEEFPVHVPDPPSEGLIGYRWTATGSVQIKNEADEWVTSYPPSPAFNPDLTEVVIRGKPGNGTIKCTMSYYRYPRETTTIIDEVDDESEIYGVAVYDETETPHVIIERDQTVHMKATPEMPRIVAYGNPYVPLTDDYWHHETKYTRRQKMDDRNYPADSPPGTEQWTNDNPWVIYDANSEILGGDQTLSHKLGLATTPDFKFKLLGKNPEDSIAKSFIISRNGEFSDWSWAIAKHETNKNPHFYNQFNPGNVKKDEPYLHASANSTTEGDRGWGMCQIDYTHKRSELGDVTKWDATTAEVWNWNTNVDSMFVKLNEKKLFFQGYINALVFNYGPSGINEEYRNRYVDPPNWPLEAGASYYFSGSHAAIVSLYNGANGPQAAKYRKNDPFKLLVRESDGSLRTTFFLTCWDFLRYEEEAEDRWRYVPNDKNYLGKVHEVIENEP